MRFFLQKPYLLSGAVLLLFAALGPLPMLWMSVENLSLASESLSSTFQKRNLGIFFNSLKLATLSAILASCLGLLLALSLAYASPRIKLLAMVLVTINLFIPPYIHGIIWPNFASNVGHPISGEPYFISLLVVSYYPIGFYLSLFGLSKMDPNYIDLAHQKFSSTLAKLYLLKVFILPVVVFSILITFFLSFGEYGLAMLMQVNTYPVEIFTEFSAFYNMEKAFQLTLPYLCITLFLWLGVCRLFYSKHANFMYLKKVEQQQARGAYTPWSVLSFISLLFLALFPIAVMITQLKGLSSFVRAWDTASEALINSMILGCLLVLVLALPSIAIAKAQLKWKASKMFMWDNVYWLPFIWPGVFIGIAYLQYYNQSAQLSNSIFLLLSSLAGVFFALLTKVMYFKFKSYSKDLRDSLDMVPRSWFYRVFVIERKLWIQAFLFASIIVFCLCLRELNLTLLLCPPGYETLAIRSFTLSHYGVNDLVIALCLFMVAIPLGFVMVYLFLFRGNSKRQLHV